MSAQKQTTISKFFVTRKSGLAVTDAKKEDSSQLEKKKRSPPNKKRTETTDRKRGRDENQTVKKKKKLKLDDEDFVPVSDGEEEENEDEIFKDLEDELEEVDTEVEEETTTSKLKGKFGSKETLKAPQKQGESSASKLRQFSFKSKTEPKHSSSEAVRSTVTSRKKAPVSPKQGGRGKKELYTPLEQQVMKIWEENEGVILAVECGYRWRFFGSDAEKVAKILRIVLVPPHGSSHFASCSVPSHRLNVHIHRLVNCGLKVGVVQQTETRALKEIGDNRNKPFAREMTQLYTKATLISPDINPIVLSDQYDQDDEEGPDVGGYIMCICEEGTIQDNVTIKRAAGSAVISILAIQPSTGDIIYDTFEDDFLRTELETRLKHLSPVEFILPPIEESISSSVEAPTASYHISHQSDRVISNYASRSSPSTSVQSAITLNIESNDEISGSNNDEEEETQEDSGHNNNNNSNNNNNNNNTNHSTNEEIQAIRIERMEQFEYDAAVVDVTQFYNENLSKAEQNLNKESLSSIITKFSKGEVVCLGVVINYLKAFQLEGLLKLSQNFRAFTQSTVLKLTSATLEQLEILHSQDSTVNITARTSNINPYMKLRYDGSNKKRSFGSLFWVLNQTLSPFGSRLLKRWLINPLIEESEIQKRLDVVEELSSHELGSSAAVTAVKALLGKLPDLERGICRLYYNKCNPLEFITIMTAFQMISLSLASRKEWEKQGFRSSLLLQLVDDINNSKIVQIVEFFLSSLSLDAAKSNNIAELFLNEERFVDIVEAKNQIVVCEKKLENYLSSLAKTMNFRLKYVSILQTEYLIEVPRAHEKKVPSSWMKVSNTKAVVRYHTRDLLELYKELCRYREERKIACDAAWKSFVVEFKENYYEFRNVVKGMAELDCLLSLAKVAISNNYVRPKISPNDEIQILSGRHPIVEKLITTPFVDNHTDLSNERKCMILTGPNMGGKSCYIRQVALIVLMAQIGSFVPCKSAVISPIDQLLVRMGAQDCIEQGKSTFFIEMQETSDILRNATKRSLIILDELGRGTSTHDGVAVAYASLMYALKSIRCFTLFVTHYHILCQIEISLPMYVRNYYMSFMAIEDEGGDDENENDSSIIFLYKLTEGMASKSFGFNVARLAGIPNDIISIAQSKSNEMRLSFKYADITSIKDSFKSIYNLVYSSNDNNIQYLRNIAQILTSFK